VVVQQEAPASARTSARPRVVVFDPVTWNIPEWSYDVERRLLEARGVDLVVPATPQESDEAIRNADVVIACAIRGRVEAHHMATMRHPIGIICYSIGMNQVDHEAAKAAGIPVTNVPFCVDEVSDHAVMLLLMAERRAFTLTTRTADGDWSYAGTPEYTAIHRLRGRTVGIIGTGRIGKQVARKMRVFGYRTLGYDPNVPDPGDPQLEMGSLETLLAHSDAVITCADLNPTSRHIIREETLDQLRPGTILINIARGGLVDERALASAIRRGQIAIAGLDVRDPEPPDPKNDPLADTPTDRLILTPHMAGGSVEARETLHTLTADVALTLLAASGRIPAM
jgi:D-3-phosphoglycerate dehydrogenase